MEQLPVPKQPEAIQEQVVQEVQQHPYSKIKLFDEIFNLWFELSLMRKLLNDSIEKGQGSDGKPLISHFSEEMINEARKWAFDIVSNKFPGVQLGFVPNEPIVPLNLPTAVEPEQVSNG